MSEERVDRFLAMFLKDLSFALLCSAMETGDAEGAFRAVHTMKGICMNLSLTALLNACIALTENLRSGESNEQTQQCFEKTKEAYLQTVHAIMSHLNESE